MEQDILDFILKRDINKPMFEIIENNVFQNKIELKDLQYLDSYDEITNVKNVRIIDDYHESDLNFIRIAFLDQDDRIRVCTSCENEMYGIVRFYNFHRKIKDELIFLINEQYDIESRDI